MDVQSPVTLESRPNGCLAACWTAMASPCELLVQTDDEDDAKRLGHIAANEVWRIEKKYSRYRPDSTLALINASAGNPCRVDDETTALLDYAWLCHELSGGRFDISSGVLRKVWRFDGGSQLPDPEDIVALLPRIGLHRVDWAPPMLTLPGGMELDFGGLGKEYAADRALALVASVSKQPLLVNLGGDLCCHGTVTPPWQVGVERPGHDGQPALVLELASGALATSGDTRRFLQHGGVRYGHILDPFTGWPVAGAPRSVTVAAPRCLEAGMLATLALLQGNQAEAFLAEHASQYWCLW